MACSSCKKKRSQTSTVKKKSISQPLKKVAKESAIVEFDGVQYKVLPIK